MSVATLSTLSEDADDDVRDWATFGLGVQGDVDSLPVREALSWRLSDSDSDAREEALVGLARRHDARILAVLLTALGESLVTDRVIEAAYTLLGMERDREDWSRSDYVNALRLRLDGLE